MFSLECVFFNICFGYCITYRAELNDQMHTGPVPFIVSITALHIMLHKVKLHRFDLVGDIVTYVKSVKELQVHVSQLGL